MNRNAAVMDIKTDYVSVNHDAFDPLTTIEHLRHCRHRCGRQEVTFSWRRSIRPGSDRMILDLEIRTPRAGGWLPSKLTLLVDGQRHDLRYWPSSTSTYRRGSHYEIGLMFIEPAQAMLRTLCEAKTLKLKLHSAVCNEDILLPDAFCAQLQLQAQQFYNNTFDADAYTTSVAGVSAHTADTTFADNIARREARYKKLCSDRLIYGVLWVCVLGAIYLGDSWGEGVFSQRTHNLLIAAGWLGALSWLLPHLQILYIDHQKNQECPRCHQRTIKRVDYHEAVYQVRSEERIVIDRLTGGRKSRQVTVTDHEVTQTFECTACRHAWSRRHIARGL